MAAAFPCNPQSHCSSVVCVAHYKVQPTVSVGGIVGGITAPVVVLIAIIIALSVVVSISCCCMLLILNSIQIYRVRKYYVKVCIHTLYCFT